LEQFIKNSKILNINKRKSRTPIYKVGKYKQLIKMSQKLSESLAELSVKSKNVEDRIAKAKLETKEKLDAEIAEVRLNAEAAKNDFIAKVDATKSSIDSQMKEAKNSFQEKVAQLKSQAKAKALEIENNLANAEHNMDIRFAEADYADAVYYAQNCIEWAIIALSDVEEATLEAFSAKANLENLKNA
jgi:hypothetical protein